MSDKDKKFISDIDEYITTLVIDYSAHNDEPWVAVRAMAWDITTRIKKLLSESEAT